MIDQYGVDICCLFMMFVLLLDMSLEWLDVGVEGVNCFFCCVWCLVYVYVSVGFFGVLDVVVLSDVQKQVCCVIYLVIRQVSQDVGQYYKFNIVIVVVMILMNVLEKVLNQDVQDCVLIQEGLEIVVLLLVFIILYICYVFWGQFGYVEVVIDVCWLSVDESVLVQDIL